MGAAYTPNRILSGSWAQVWVNGELWAECTGITAKITENRTDVQQGIDVGSKLVGLKGEGTLKVDHVYTTKTAFVNIVVWRAENRAFRGNFGAMGVKRGAKRQPVGYSRVGDRRGCRGMCRVGWRAERD